MYNKGKIFNIQRFSTSDGTGIRTVIFLKGCPLSCAWCHNPESQSKATEIFYKQDLCVGCKACAKTCTQAAHVFANDMHHIERDKCIACTKCVENCYVNALEVCGQDATAEEVLDIALRDKSFYEESGGGITLSGGEPLMQYGFTLSLLKHAKKQRLHTAIETCGFTDADLSELCKYTDLWLYDIKLFSEDEHIKYTGVSNKIILDNLHLIDRLSAKIVLRCPIIPDINLSTEHFDKIAELSNSLNNVVAIHLEPYHPLGISKAEQLNKVQVYQNHKFLGKSAISPFADKLREKTTTEVVIL